jgi:uncharacterized protein
VNVVLDTNILISACWKPGGLEEQTVNLAIDGVFRPCVTPQICAEYRDVLSRDKFIRIRDQAARMLAALETRALIIPSTMPVDIASDDDDNRFLECAAAAHADFLVTGNLKHFPAVWGITTVVNARQFLERVPAK